jgi:hypothetical protein
MRHDICGMFRVSGFGDENAMIMRRVRIAIRHHFPDTHISVRGDGHSSGPELMGLIDSMVQAPGSAGRNIPDTFVP